MDTIRKLPNGKFRAEIRRSQTFIKAKTFVNKTQSKQWADKYDCNIETILNLTPKKLKKLSPSKVESLGGLELFQKLGIDIEFMTFKRLANEYMMQWT